LLGHQLSDASLLVPPEHRPRPVQLVAGEHPRDVIEKRSGQPGVLLVLEPQQLNLSADKLAPAEVVGEAEQRRELRILRTAAALGQIAKELAPADIVQPITQLPSGVQQRTTVTVEYDLGVRAALFRSALLFSFRHLELRPPRKGRTHQRDHGGDTGNN
jgi:hypothetical protein